MKIFEILFLIPDSDGARFLGSLSKVKLRKKRNLSKTRDINSRITALNVCFQILLPNRLRKTTT